MAKSKIANQVQGFVVLPLQRPAQTAFPHAVTHYLYIRPNAPQIPTESAPRELFLVNIPFDATKQLLRSWFTRNLGGVKVEDVEFEDSRAGRNTRASHGQLSRGKKRKRGAGGEGSNSNGNDEGPTAGGLPEIWDRKLHQSGGSAIVRFVDRASAEVAIKAAKKIAKNGLSLSWGGPEVEDSAPQFGSARYLSHHRLRYPNAASLQASVDSFMAAFSAGEAQQARKRTHLRSVPDEEGFVTVVRGGRVGPAREEEARAREAELRKREKGRVHDGFYRFQVRERRKQQAQELVKGFEEDRRKVEEMRTRRGRVRPE